jgi:hypothetical protein
MHDGTLHGLADERLYWMDPATLESRRASACVRAAWWECSRAVGTDSCSVAEGSQWNVQSNGQLLVCALPLLRRCRPG